MAKVQVTPGAAKYSVDVSEKSGKVLMSRNTRNLVSTFLMLGPAFMKMDEARDTRSVPLAVFGYGVEGPHQALAAAVLTALWGLWALVWSIFVLPFALLFKKKAEAIVKQQDLDAQVCVCA